jgi:hypothetical protein
MAKIIPQPYPRIQDSSSPYHGCLDDSTLVPHFQQITSEHMKALILSAIENANAKSSREILSIPEDATDDEVARIYKKEGRELFRYFRKYPGDPAATAYQLKGRHYREVGIEQFRNRTLQKERMNSGWRYQFLAAECARNSEQVSSESDLDTEDADFRTVINSVGYSCLEIMNLVLAALRETTRPDNSPSQITAPEPLLDAFGQACAESGLVDGAGYFSDPYKLVEFFCGD